VIIHLFKISAIQSDSYILFCNLLLENFASWILLTVTISILTVRKQMAVDDMGSLSLTEKEFSLRWNVWRALHEWIQMTAKWRTSPVHTLSSAEVLGKTDEYAKDAYKMGKANKEDTVVFRLKDAIEDFKKVHTTLILVL
jgi:hypothetical protein